MVSGVCRIESLTPDGDGVLVAGETARLGWRSDMYEFWARLVIATEGSCRQGRDGMTLDLAGGGLHSGYRMVVPRWAFLMSRRVVKATLEGDYNL